MSSKTPILTSNSSFNSSSLNFSGFSEDSTEPEILTFGVTSRDREIIQKANGRFHFPWENLMEHKFSINFTHCLLSEMTPYAVAETEDYIVVLYSPTKLIGGSEIGKLAAEKYAAKERTKKFLSKHTKIPSNSCTNAESSPSYSSPGFLAKMKRLFRI